LPRRSFFHGQAEQRAGMIAIGVDRSFEQRHDFQRVAAQSRTLAPR